MAHLPPTLLSIDEVRKRLGGIGRTMFYVTILPQLEMFAKQCDRPAATKKLGRRRMVYAAVLEAFILSRLWWPVNSQVMWHLWRYSPLGSGGFHQHFM